MKISTNVHRTSTVSIVIILNFFAVFQLPVLAI